MFSCLSRSSASTRDYWCGLRCFFDEVGDTRTGEPLPIGALRFSGASATPRSPPVLVRAIEGEAVDGQRLAASWARLHRPNVPRFTESRNPSDPLPSSRWLPPQDRSQPGLPHVGRISESEMCSTLRGRLFTVFVWASNVACSSSGDGRAGTSRVRACWKRFHSWTSLARMVSRSCSVVRVIAGCC